MSQGVLNVGIDLGTSRSSISASNGERHVVDSYVGWPVDMVARKVLRKGVLIGREALDNRSMLDLHRPLERGLIKEGSEKDEAAVRELFLHLLGTAGAAPERKGQRVRAVVGVPAEAMRVNKQSLRKALTGLTDSLLIVSEPFAVAYGLDALLHSLILDIGAGTTDLCVMNGRYPTEDDQKTLTVAGDFVDEQLAKLVREKNPTASFSIHMVREWKEKHSFVGEPAEAVKVTAPVQGKPTEIDITREMRVACEALLPPIAEAIVDLISRVEPEFQEKVRRNVIVSGGGGLIRGLAGALERVLGGIGGGSVRVVDDPVFVGSDGGLAIAIDAPDSDWERLSA